jgi:hypothetical protein
MPSAGDLEIALFTSGRPSAAPTIPKDTGATPWSAPPEIDEIDEIVDIARSANG